MTTTTTHVDVPTNAIRIPLSLFCAGAILGTVRGARAAGVQYMAENGHHLPTTKEGWYFYFKTKNYRVAYGALKGAMKQGGKAGAIGCCWSGIEEGCTLIGGHMEDLKSVVAGAGTMGLLSTVYRLGIRNSIKLTIVGSIGGLAMTLIAPQ